MLRLASPGLLASSWLVLSAAAAMCARASAAELPPPITDKSPLRVWVDQIGYRTDGRKLAIVAADAAITEAPALELVNVSTGQTVWRLADHKEAFRPFNKGQKDGVSGDYCAHLDFTEFRTPGRYYVLIRPAGPGGKAERSYQFNIADNPYYASAIASWRMFYYNRADCEKPEKYAGPWNHKMTHRGPGQATEARVYKWEGRPHWEPVGKEVLDPTPRDVTGAWWDAGDFNKYMGNTTIVHNQMLHAAQLLRGAKDNQFNIPESGNGVPDLLDEIRYGTEFVLKMADETGAAFGKCHEMGACPPESNTTPVQLTVQTSGATMNRLSCLAYAALVWREKGVDAAFADRCLKEALKAWKLLEAKPHPWPADPKNPKKTAPTGNWFEADYAACRALAAACFWRLTGDDQYRQAAEGEMQNLRGWPPGEGMDWYPAMWVYIHTKGASAPLVEKLRKLMIDAGEGVVRSSGERAGYGANLRGWWWGSNRLVGNMGVAAICAAELSDDPAAKRRYLDAAEEYIHYLHGRNPLGLCYLTNMKQFGAERSAMVMFHSWLGNPSKRKDPYGSRFIGEGEGKIGPPPGYVVGGANGGPKKYNDTLDGEPWIYNEPDIGYQSPCALLLGYFGMR